MKWVRFEDQGTLRWGVLHQDRITATSLAWVDILMGHVPDMGPQYQQDEVRLLAPVEHPAKVVAIGLNYWDHCRETNTPPPHRPIVFTKFSTAIIGLGTPITWSATLTREVDYEAELAVVIGKVARRAPEDRALDYVFGYTAANDVSARDLQFSDGQWVRAKSLDTFCPLGPALITADKIGDPQNLAIRCDLNGQRVQDSSTSEMIFGVAALISFCSHAFTLEPGDVILTGTPHGTGGFRNPKLFMQHGDMVTVEIEGIGRLQNPCVVED